MKEDWSGTGSFFLSTWLIIKISFKKNYDSDADILCHNASLHGVALHCIASPLFISTNWITQYKWSWLTLGTGIIYIGRTDEILKKWLRFCCCVCNRDTKNTRLEFLMKPTNLHWWRRRWRLFGGGRGGAILSLVFLPWHSLSYWLHWWSLDWVRAPLSTCVRKTVTTVTFSWCSLDLASLHFGTPSTCSTHTSLYGYQCHLWNTDWACQGHLWSQIKMNSWMDSGLAVGGF